jgi:hypothetical protein
MLNNIPLTLTKDFMLLLCLQRNKVMFLLSQTANVNFKCSLLNCGKDPQFVFPNASFFHSSENSASTLSSQYLSQLQPLKLHIALTRWKCRRSPDIFWTILTHFYALDDAARTLPPTSAFRILYYYFSYYFLLDAPKELTTVNWFIASLIELTA